ncbi:hypothetical protein LUZ60_013599 [Juncus effusus]|nr:hypothetical protein LUZ60_013599 [Juncus effusus]
MALVDKEAIKMLLSSQFWRMAVLWTASILYSYLRLLFSSSSRRSNRLQLSPESDRPVCVITGATSGLGKAAARELAREGFHVILAARDSELLLKTIEEIKEQEGNVHLDAIQVDLSSYKSIKNFEINLKKQLSDSNLHPSIQILINNAGILAKNYRETPDGFDEMMETNYIGAFILTNLLMPLMQNSPKHSRIVNVTSFTHRCVFDFDVHEVLFAKRNYNNRSYPCASIYEHSKLCLLLFTYELHRRFYIMDPTHNLSIMAADPGIVETKIMRELPPILSKFAILVLRILRVSQSPKIGVSSIIDAALASHEASGKYFFGGKGRTINSSCLSFDTKLAEKLWSDSCILLK